MRSYAIPLVFALAAGLSMPAHASAEQLKGQQIKSTISGKTVRLATRWGAFPLRYSGSGRVTGDGTGMGLAKFFAPKETGSWWVDGNRMCQKFPTWYKGRTFCFTLTKTGPRKLAWTRNDGYSGTATVSN